VLLSRSRPGRPLADSDVQRHKLQPGEFLATAHLPDSFRDSDRDITLGPRPDGATPL